MSKVNKFLLTSSNHFASVFSLALCDGGIADGTLILEETKESRPPIDADPGETEILQLQPCQQETGIVCFFLNMLKIAAARHDHLQKFLLFAKSALRKCSHQCTEQFCPNRSALQ